MRFSKNTQKFRDKLFIAEGQTERGRDMMSLTFAFRNFVTSLQTRHGSPDSFIAMCRMRRSLTALRSFLLSPLSYPYTLSCHTSPTTIIPSSLTSSCYLFLGLPLNFVLPKSYITLFWKFYFLPASVKTQKET